MTTPPRVGGRNQPRRFRNSMMPPPTETDSSKESRANVLLASERTFSSWVGGMVIPLSFLGTVMILFSSRGGFAQQAGIFIEWSGLTILLYILTQISRRTDAITRGGTGPFFDVIGPVFSTIMLVFGVAVQQYYNLTFVPTRNIEVA